MNLFRSAFSYFASKTIFIPNVEIIVPSDSRHSLTYALIEESSGLTLWSVKVLNSYVMISTIGADHPLNCPSTPNMIFSKNLRYNPKSVSKSLPRIILYLLLANLSTGHFHATILVAPNSVSHNSMFTFVEVVNLPAWIYHEVSVEFFWFKFFYQFTHYNW